MTEGYADREDPSLYFGLALVDRPGEELVAWTTTPWTVAANVAAAVHPTLDYELVEFDGRKLWIGASRRTATLGGGAPRAVLLETRKGSELIGWKYRAPFDDLPAVREALGPDGAAHSVIGWDDVGSEEGTCIVHIAPGCGSDDHKLGVAEGLTVEDSLGLAVLGVADGLAVGDSPGFDVAGLAEGLAVGLFIGLLLGEFVVTVTDKVTFKVVAPAVVFNWLTDESSASLGRVPLLALTASWYSFWRVSTKLPSAIELVSSFFTKSSS